MLLAAAVLCAAAAPAWAKIEPEASRAYYEAAAKLVEQGDLRAAVIELKNALQRDPANAVARLLLGEVYLRLGDGAAAEKELRAAGRHGMDADRTLVPLGQALLLQGRFQEILAHLEAASPARPLDLEVLLVRAAAHTGLGQWEEARSVYRAAEQRDPQAARVYVGMAQLELAAGDFPQAEAHAAAALERQAGLAEALLLQAEARRLGGRPDAALAPFRAVLEGPAQPAGVRARTHLGLAASLIALERDAEAEREVAAAQQLVPGVPLAAYLQALIKVRQQDLTAARQVLDAAAPSLEAFPPAQFLFGVVYYAAEELETARSWLARHLVTHPENLQARKLMATVLLRLNATEEAVKLLQPAQSQAPDDPQVLLLLGNAYLRSGRAAEASSLLQRAAELSPQDPKVLSQLAISHMATGQRDEALAALKATLDLGADASAIGYTMVFAHLRAGAFGDALKVAQDLRRRFPQSPIAANLEGGAYAALGQLEQAQASFDAVLALDPQFHEARANLAALKARAGDFAGAEAEYRAILAADENHVTALMGMAALADRRDDKAETRRWLDSAVRADPGGVKPSLALAEYHAAAGDPAAAVTVMEALSKRQPRNPQVLVALGRFHTWAGEPAAAVRSYQRLVEVDGGTTGARLLLAEAQLVTGDLEAARKSYEDLVNVAADDPVVWNNLAWLYQQAGDHRAAVHGERALELAPDQPAVMDTLGWILLDEEGQVERAAELLEQAHRAVPANADIAYHYATALHRTGNDAAARGILQPLLQSDQPFSAKAEAAALLESLAP